MKKIILILLLYIVLICSFCFIFLFKKKDYVIDNSKVEIFKSDGCVDIWYKSNYVAEILEKLFKNELEFDTNKLSYNFKNKFIDKYSIIKEYDESFNLYGSVDYDLRLDKKETVLLSLYKNITDQELEDDPIYTVYCFIYRFNDRFQLDDLTLVEKYERYATNDKRVDKKETITTIYEVNLSMTAWLASYDEEICTDLNVYDGVLIEVNDTTKIINKPILPTQVYGGNTDRIWNIDTDLYYDKGFFDAKLYNYDDQTQNKRWKIIFKFNKQNVFTYLEFINIPFNASNDYLIKA